MGAVVTSALTRGTPTAMLATLAQPIFYPVILVYLDWPDTPVFLHSNYGTLMWDSVGWHGVGHFGDMTIPEESLGMAAQSAEMRLIGLPAELDDYLDDPIRNRPARVWFGVVTERAGNVLVADPVEVFSGYMDAMRDNTQASDDGLSRGVILSVAPGPSQRSRAEVYHTYEDQMRAYPGDTAGRFSINIEATVATMLWPE